MAPVIASYLIYTKTVNVTVKSWFPIAAELLSPLFIENIFKLRSKGIAITIYNFYGITIGSDDCNRSRELDLVIVVWWNRSPDSIHEVGDQMQ